MNQPPEPRDTPRAAGLDSPPTPTDPTRHARATRDETLLCEACGYPIDGLPTHGTCPECGKPLAESLPERRTGTPWQQQATRTGCTPLIQAMSATVWALLRHPRASLDTMRFDEEARRAARRFQWACVIGASLAASAGVALAGVLAPTFEGSGSNQARGIAVGTPWALGIVPIALMLLLTLLTWIEATGLVFFGRQRRLRLTRAIAETICAHGCAGWLLAGLIILAAGLLTSPIFGLLSLASVLADARPAPFRRDATAFASVSLLGAVLGLLAFETFAYLGLQRCGFANAPRSP